MAKKSSSSSQPARLKWTENERQALRRAAAKQATRENSRMDLKDIPAITKEQLTRMVTLREVRRKVPVSVRLDPRVLEWLKSKGEGHLTRINDILTNLNGSRATDAASEIAPPREGEKRHCLLIPKAKGRRWNELAVPHFALPLSHRYLKLR